MSAQHFEDIFKNFYSIAWMHIDDAKDSGATDNFNRIISQNLPLTKKQAFLAVKLLDKYKILSLSLGYDYRGELTTATWKNKFREIDMTKSISVVIDDNNRPEIHLKFPYALKNEFDSEFKGHHPWNNEQKSRVIDFYKIDLIKLSEFVIKHEFIIDSSFTDSLEKTEKIWESSEKFIPYAKIENNEIKLFNAVEDAEKYFKSRKGHSIDEQAFLAKSMGYPVKLEKTELSSFEKIISSSSNKFYIDNLDIFFLILTNISGKAAILLDRTTNAQEWIREFLKFTEKNKIPNNKIRVCFRESDDSKRQFNKWIQENNLGGKVADGEIYIFQNSLPKWLFNDENSVKIVLTNLLHPSTSSRIQEWIDSHSCVLYAGLWEPAMAKGNRIEKL